MRILNYIISGAATCALGSTPNKTNTANPFALASGTRVAVAFHGHYMRNSTRNIEDGSCSNYFNAAANIEENLLKPLREGGMKVDVFLHTMSDSGCPANDKKLVRYLQPVVFKFDELLPYVAYSYEAVLKLVLGRRSDIDVVMLVRFDVVYRSPVTALDVRWDRLNFAFMDMVPTELKVSDLFFVLPIGWLPEFLHSLSIMKSRDVSAHWVLNTWKRFLYPVHAIDPNRGSSRISRQYFKNGSTNFTRFLAIDRNCSGVGQCIVQGAASQRKCSSFTTSGTCPSDGCDWRNAVCQTCSWQCYLDRYVDLQREFGVTITPAARTHWQTHGRREGRDCTCS